MNKEQAVSYLRFSGFSDEQIRAIEGAFSCEDAISRKAVMEHYSTGEIAHCNHISRNNLLDFIEQLPPVTPQLKTRWIPVSERLPEIHQDVLLSFRSLDVEVGFRGNTEPYYYCHGDYIEPQNVLAWQPLPEPYKAEGSGE